MGGKHILVLRRQPAVARLPHDMESVVPADPMPYAQVVHILPRPNGETGFDRELILRAYRDDVAGIPVLGDLEGFQDAWQGRHSRASSASAQYI